MPKSYIGLIGVNSDNKCYAARFNASDLEAVQKAADLMKLSVAIPKSAEAVRLLSKLPPGKLLKNGNAMVPLFKGPHDELLGAFMPQATQPESAEKNSDKPDRKIGTIASWDDLAVGMTVLCPEVLPRENGFWPGTIIAIARDGRLTVKWDDNPKQLPSTFSPREVSLMYPKGK